MPVRRPLDNGRPDVAVAPAIEVALEVMTWHPRFVEAFNAASGSQTPD